MPKIENASLQKQEFTRLRSTPRMWIVFFIYLAIVSGITIACLSHLFNIWSEDTLPTKVFTVEDDVISLKIPDDWTITSDSDGNQVTFKSGDSYESLSIATMDDATVTAASITFMLEIQGMFPDVKADMTSYSEMELGNKKAYVTQVEYYSKYYLCGVMESGNTIIKFVYSASVMAGEIADIDMIIGSINYRDK